MFSDRQTYRQTEHVYFTKSHSWEYLAKIEDETAVARATHGSTAIMNILILSVRDRL